MNKKIVFSVWIPQGVSSCISSATSVALSLYLYHLTNSQLILTSILSLSALTSIYFSPLAGGIADTVNKRNLLFLGSILSAFFALAIGFGAYQEPRIPVLYLSILCSGIINASIAITLQSLVRDLSHHDQLIKVNAFISIVQNAPILIGPALGSMLYTILDFKYIVVINAFSFLLAGVFAFVALKNVELQQYTKKKNWFNLPFQGAQEGFLILWKDKVMLRCQLWYSLSNFGNGLAAGLITPYIILTSKNSNAAIGSFGTFRAIGVLLAAGYLYLFKLKGKKSHWVIISMTIGALFGRLPLVLTNSILIISIVAFIRSAALELSNAPLLSIWQQVTAKNFQGRIFGARKMLAQGPYPIAVWLGGKISVWLTNVLGSKETAIRHVILIGVTIELISVLGSAMTRGLFKLEERHIQ